MKLAINIRNICFISIFTAITAVCAQISIPNPTGVPFTLQTFAIPLAGIILGAKSGTLSASVYIFLGISGVPVFTGFSGGIAVLFGKTGGYIISFPVMALCAGISSDLYENVKIKNIWIKNAILAGGLILGAVINYISGMLWGKFFLTCSMRDAFLLFVLPYIPTAVVKIILSGIFGISVKKILIKSKLLL
ncbi:MAG: biotin transporter BioY [Oscillospiraceae bacterium]|nr:biotin transporter BioY [Oscillospiraceae bacterium]